MRYVAQDQIYYGNCVISSTGGINDIALQATDLSPLPSCKQTEVMILTFRQTELSTPSGAENTDKYVELCRVLKERVGSSSYARLQAYRILDPDSLLNDQNLIKTKVVVLHASAELLIHFIQSVDYLLMFGKEKLLSAWHRQMPN